MGAVGVALLAAATTAGLRGFAAASGLGRPGLAPTLRLMLSATCAAGLLLRERRAVAPLLEQGLTEVDLVEGAIVVPSGVGHLVARQGQGWAYLRP